MNSRSFNMAFRQQKPRKASNGQSCVAASGDAMNSIGVYEGHNVIVPNVTFPNVTIPNVTIPNVHNNPKPVLLVPFPS